MSKNIFIEFNIFRSIRQNLLTALTSRLYISSKLFNFFGILLITFFLFTEIFSQNRFEDRAISEVSVTFEGKDSDVTSRDQFQIIAREALGGKYSAVKVRDALDALYTTQRISSIMVEATEAAQNSVNLRFIIKRKTQVQRVTVNVGNTVGDEITEEDILYRLNLVTPGNVVSEPILQRNADLILDYLRDRGFFKSEVGFTQQPLEDDTEVAVIFNITPNTQATVDEFKIDIQGFDAAKVREKLKLKTGEAFTRELLIRMSSASAKHSAKKIFSRLI